MGQDAVVLAQRAYIWWTLVLMQTGFAACYAAACAWAAWAAHVVQADGTGAVVSTWADAYAYSLGSDAFVQAVSLPSTAPLNGLIAVAILFGLRLAVCLANIGNLMVNHPRAREHWLGGGMKLVIMYGYFQDYLNGLNTINLISSFLFNGVLFAMSLAYLGEAYMTSMKYAVLAFGTAGILFAVDEASVVVRTHRRPGHEDAEQREIAALSKGDLVHAAPVSAHHNQAWDGTTIPSAILLLATTYTMYYTPFASASSFYDSAEGTARSSTLLLFWVPVCWTAALVGVYLAGSLSLRVAYWGEALRTAIELSMSVLWTVALVWFVKDGPLTDVAAILAQ